MAMIVKWEIIDLSKIVRAAANSVAILLIKLSQHQMRVKLKAPPQEAAD